ncbi:MAG: PmoA family protein [Candidatus Hydrogenedentes bacterium]|nr:PmoA family protein [Candidatus Hydrogenedentota bacterium]
MRIPVTYGDCPHVQLQDARTKRLIPCQVSPIGKETLLSWLVDKLAAGDTQLLKASTVKEAPERPRVALLERLQDHCVDVVVCGKPFTTYHYGAQWVRPFLHPVLGPGDTPVTRTWPIEDHVRDEDRDHAHHKSIWVAYGACGRVDNWSEDPGHGYQRHRAFQRLISGPVYAELAARIDWCDNRDRKQFEELRSFRFYGLPGGVRLFDVQVRFRMSQGPVVFHDTKEGGLLAVRMASALSGDRGGRIENGYGGVTEAETWGKKAPWCDYSGTIAGRRVGVAVMDHESNPRYPTEWHVRSYGLMTANCFAWKHYNPDGKIKGDMSFPKGATRTWRYRVYIHTGDAAQGRVRGRFLDFVAPPRVRLE